MINNNSSLSILFVIIMLHRQKTILLLLEYSGGSASRLQLTKWAFLLSKQSASIRTSAFYDFLPYHFGPYSFLLHRELLNLTEKGLTEKVDEKTWSITNAGKIKINEIASTLREDVFCIIKRYLKMPVHSLMNEVYQHYPWFTINSRIKSKRMLERPKASSAVYTIGYEKLTIDNLLNKLIKNGIECLIDVRMNPIARMFGYHKSTLSRLCASINIKYHHFPQLGIPSSSRANLKNKSDYDKLFKKYELYNLPKAHEFIGSVADLICKKPSALFCMEADPKFCHRSVLANKISNQTGLPVSHLYWPR